MSSIRFVTSAFVIISICTKSRTTQTIDSIIPPLVDSLRKQKGGPLAGASEILLSFVATFEHIPSHRSMGLFHSLVDKLGPEEFLFALLGMLMHKYSAKGIINDFAVVLTSQYSVLTQLHVSQFTKCHISDGADKAIDHQKVPWSDC